MKLVLIFALLVCLAVPAQATYYEITSGYTPGLTLDNSDSLLMTGGGLDILTLFESSSATIQNTSSLVEGSGGIWEFNLAGDSHLDFSGGELRNLDIGRDATAILSGGRIDSIESSQIAWEWDYGVDPPEWVTNPHITIESLDYSYNTPTNLLTGYWLDGTDFSIQLIDVNGYSPAIENIQFIPEPATLILLGLGGLLLRRKK